MRTLLTLLTDFGTADPWVAAVKGVLYSEWNRWPSDTLRPRIVDLGHEVPRGDIEGAAWFLRYAAPEYPVGTVHLAVVDPGVGGERPALALRTGGCVYVAPGNGLLRPIVRAAEESGDEVRVVRLDNPLYRRDETRGAATFHGRDVFAPAAAHLALGVPLEQVGTPCGTEAVGLLPGEGFPAGSGAAGHTWRICWIDRYGNAITDLPRTSEAGRRIGAGREVEIGGRRVAGPLKSYVYAEPGVPFWYWGSGGTLEVAVRDASAADLLKLKRGLALHVPGL